VAHAFDIGEPKQLALSGLEMLKGAPHVERKIEVRRMCRLGGLGEGLVFVSAPAIAEEVGGDAKEIAPQVVGFQGRPWASQKPAEGLLHEIFCDLAAAGDRDEVTEDRPRVGVIDARKLRFGHLFGPRSGIGNFERAGE
jgi:hypothetical protein